MLSTPKHLPRYLNFAQQLRARIDSGQLAPGDKLPAQRDLAEQFGTTLMTIRKGLDVLAADGAIRIEHGVGTFVNDPSLADNDYQLLSFSHVLQQRAVNDTHTQPLDVRANVTHEQARRGLQLPTGATLTVLSRLRLVDGVPISYQQSYLPPHLHAVATAYTAQASLYRMLQAATGQPVTAAREILQPIVLSAEQAAILKCQAGDPAWLSIRVSVSADNRPILYDEAILKHDHFVITLEHSGRRATCQLQMVDSQSPQILDYLIE